MVDDSRDGMEIERRMAPRIEKPLIAKYCLDSQSPSWDSTTIRNLSRTGVFLNTRRNFPKGETLKLLLKIPFKPFNWLEIKGKVIESAGDATHIKFMDLDKEHEQLINEYVEWVIRQNPPKGTGH